MTRIHDRAEDLRRALRRVHRGVLATLAACALVIALQGDRARDADPEAAGRPLTLAALGLGLGSVLARRQAGAPRTPPRQRIPLAVAALLLAGAIGLLGAGLALTRHQLATPLLYTLGGALLALRGTPEAVLPAPPSEPA